MTFLIELRDGMYCMGSVSSADIGQITKLLQAHWDAMKARKQK